MTSPPTALRSFLITLAGIAVVVLAVTVGYDRFVTEPRQGGFDQRQGELLDIAHDLCDTAEGLRLVVLAFPPPGDLTAGQRAAYADLRSVECG